jgi:GGDEF domain-containing protein
LRLPGGADERSLATAFDTHFTGRLAAAVWAAIALAGAIATIGPLEIPTADVSEMRLIAASAGFFAGVTFVVPWERLPRFAFSAMLVLMSLHIAGLAYASGAAHSDLTIIFTLVVALAAAFMPVRTTIAPLCLIAIMLTVLLLIVGRADSAKLEVLRVTLLLATLVTLCGLVVVMRALLGEDKLGLRVRGSLRYSEGLISEDQLAAAVEAEMSRAARHDRALSVVMIEVTGELTDRIDENQERRLVASIAREVLNRIRVEDSAAHLHGLRFAVMAPETPATGAAAVAGTVADMVRRRLITAGYDGGTFDVAVGWADFPGVAETPAELIAAATDSLERGDRGLAGEVAFPTVTPRPAAGH